MDKHARDRLIAKLGRRIQQLDRIPAHRRNAEHADVITESCRAMIADLRSGHSLAAREGWDGLDIMELLRHG